MFQEQRQGASGEDDYAFAAGRIMARSAVQQGAIADQMAGDDAAALGLRRVAALAAALGRPQDALTIVHVAGTKGKGSTVAFISAMLVAAGYRTGRYTSPHLAKLTERIAIDDIDLDDASFALLASQVIAAAESIEREQPALGLVNALEILFVMALVGYREAGCHVAVIEVGIGGRLDTTNMVDPAVSVITTLDLEHTAILGSTLAEIASEKAGIIKPGRSVVVAPQPEEAMLVVRNRIQATGSQLTEVDIPAEDSLNTETAMPGAHQRLNAALALAALDALALSDPRIVVDLGAREEGMRRAWLPGRFEMIPAETVRPALGQNDGQPFPGLVLDGAHTPRAAAALRQTLSDIPSQQEGHGEVVICGFASDKDIRTFLAALAPAQILPVATVSPRAVPPEQIRLLAEELLIPVLDGPATVADGMRWLIDRRPGPGRIVVTGSFVVVAEARAALGLARRPD